MLSFRKHFQNLVRKMLSGVSHFYQCSCPAQFISYWRKCALQDNTFSWLCSSSTCIQSPAPLNTAADKQKTLSAKYFCLREAKEINCFSTQSHSHSELMHSIKTTPPQKYTYTIFYLYFIYSALQQRALKPFKSHRF